MATQRICSVEGCGKKHVARGFCRAHLWRWRKYGDPLAGRTPVGVPLKWLRSHIDHQGEDCLPWPFAKFSDGYAEVVFDGRPVKAARVMCIMAHGNSPEASLDAAHSCGNGHLGCVNPRHLRWATRSDNLMDRVEHGTANRGIKNGAAKLTNQDVIAIRKLEGRMNQGTIAKTFGVSATAVWMIHTRKNWAWLE